MDLLITDPPSFTLLGNTRGGPPEISTWTRNGEVISDNDSYSISLAVNEVNRIDLFMEDFDEAILQQSRYRSTLTVTGYLPGMYVYSVINRAMSTPRTASFTIEGTSYRMIAILTYKERTLQKQNCYFNKKMFILPEQTKFPPKLCCLHETNIYFVT